MDGITELLCRCALRDQKALEQLYAKTSSKLYALALNILQQQESAEDVLQDAYVKIWSNADQYQIGKSAAMTWMYSIVRNCALDKLRSVKRTPITQDIDVEGETLDLASPANSPAKSAAIQFDTELLVSCLAGLNVKQKNAILMSYYHGYSHQELATRFSAPLGTVKAWVRVGLKHLRNCLNRAV